MALLLIVIFAMATTASALPPKSEWDCDSYLGRYANVSALKLVAGNDTTPKDCAAAYDHYLEIGKSLNYIAAAAEPFYNASQETSAAGALSIGDAHLKSTKYSLAEPFYRHAYTLISTKFTAGHFLAKAMLRRWNKVRKLNGNQGNATETDATGVNTPLNKSTVPIHVHCTNVTIGNYSTTHHLSGTTCVAHTVCDGASTAKVAGNATTDTTCPCAAGYHNETTVDNIQTCEECAAGYMCAGGATPFVCAAGYGGDANSNNCAACTGDTYKDSNGNTQCVAKKSCAAASVVELSAGSATADRTCECASNHYSYASGTNTCTEKKSCAAASVVELSAGSATADRTCQCASNHYSYASGTNTCTEKKSCAGTVVEDSAGSTIADRTCKCASGHDDYNLALNTCSVSTTVEMTGCVIPSGWVRPYGNVAISAAGAESCKAQCKAGGYMYYGLECPMGSDVHCQCHGDSSLGLSYGDEYCEGTGNPLVHAHNHCSGPYIVDGYRFGDYTVGSVYLTN